MKLFTKLNPYAFFIALCIGLFACYIITPTPNIILKYPTPENSGMLTYIDKASNCYKYKAIEVKCPKNKEEITEPIED